MEVPSTKASSLNQSEPTNDSNNPSSAASFFDFLMGDASTIAKDAPQAAASEEKSEDLSQQKNPNSSDIDQNLLVLLNYMTTVAQQKPDEAQNAQSDLDPLLIAQKTQQLNSANTIKKDVSQNQLTNTTATVSAETAMPVTTAPQFDDASFAKDATDLSKLQTADKVAADPTLYQLIENTDSTQTDALKKALDQKIPMQMNSIPNVEEGSKKIADKKLSQADIHSAKTDAKIEDISAVSMAPAANNKEIQPSNSLNVNAEFTLQNNAAAHKSVDVFAQLGHFINSYTNANPLLEQKTASFIETAKTASFQPTDLTSVDLLPPTMDAINHEIYNAKIKIYPPELGPVTAQLRLDKNNAELVILTDNSHVKQIVEAHLTQLRDHFQRADINLTHVQVQANHSESGDQNKGNSKAQEERIDEGKSPLNQQVKTSSAAPRATDGLVDTYA